MTDKNWEDEELWIVTASTPGDRTKEGVNAVTGNGNPYSSPPVTVEEIKDSRLKALTGSTNLVYCICEYA
ncbi:hypothetical protein ACSQ6I_11190 [Anabaena sp. WFMT]|uniref:hypothetical protein n=1 Tax=Anabaena sp. WFMT TaxID=3449730 RepID=UPI003F2096E7